MSLLFRFLMGLFMSIFCAFSLSLFVPIVMGVPIVWIGVLMGTIYGTIIGTIVMTVLPVIPLSMKYAVKCGAKEGSVAWFLLKDVLLCTFMLLIISFCLTWINTGMDAQFVDRWLATAPIMWIINYAVAIQAEPLCLFLASKISRTNPFEAPAPAPAPAAPGDVSPDA